MATNAQNKQAKKQQHKNRQRFSGACEYRDILYGHKRKATQNLCLENPDIKRVTRSKGPKTDNVYTDSPELQRTTLHKQNRRLPSKIPLRQNNQDKAKVNMSGEDFNSSKPSHSSGGDLSMTINEEVSAPPASQVDGAQQFVHQAAGDGNAVNTSASLNPSPQIRPTSEVKEVFNLEDKQNLEGSPLAVFLEDDGLSQKNSPPNVSFKKGADIDILQTLASMNQRLKTFDKLEEMNCTLKGEISRVQSQVGGVSNQVNTVKSDLKRCEVKWEASADAVLGRISKVEQGLQAFELKWESGNSDVQDELSAVQSNIAGNSAKINKL